MHLKLYSYLVFAILIGFFSCNKNIFYLKTESNNQELKSFTETDSSILSIIKPYKTKIGDDLKTVISDVKKDLTLGKPESLLGNFMVDLSYEMTKKYLDKKIDIGFLNHGGIRIPVLPKGQLIKEKIFELMPFENHLVAVEIKGEELQELFNHIAKNGGWPISKNIKMVIQANKAVDVKINGEDIDKSKTYLVSTIDYLANGGDKCSFLKNKKKYHTGVLLRDAIIEYAQDKQQKKESLDANIEERIFILK